MNIIFIILICILSIGIFMLHAYSKYGGRATFNFFFFSFFVATIKEGPMRINGIWMKNPAMPYEFVRGQPAIIVNTFLAMFGWVFTFYLGWYIADKISRRLYPAKVRIFTLIFLAGLVTASIGYAVEATAIGSGWWHWTLEDIRMSRFLVGIPFIAVVTWMHFPTQYLFAPYFLINFSKFKDTSWKGVFFIIPLIHSLTADFKPEFVRVNLEYLALAVLIILAFISPLRFDYPKVKLPILPNFLKFKWLEFAPMLIAFFLLFILMFLDLVKVQNVRLLISLLPLLILILFSIRRIPLSFTVFLGLLFSIIFRETILPVVIIVMLVVLLKGLTKVKTRGLRI